MRRTIFRSMSGFAGTLGLAAALAGCGVKFSPTPAPASPGPASSSPASPSPAGTAWSFTVTGNNPVASNDSQATNLTNPGDGCSEFSLAADKALGDSVASGFAADGYPVAASLLRHFLTGSGTKAGYQASSAIAQQARASSPFQAVNSQVQAAVLGQLRSGRTSVELSADQLPTVAFENDKTDLYWAFRGTQGLSVTGRGTRGQGRYSGTLSYVIRDSYGFPASDTLQGVGSRMRYLQTSCGAPQHAGGARWFPDTVTVTVPFSQPAS